MASTNGTAPALLLRIKNMIGQMSKAEKKVASFILENPNDVISFSVASLAEASGVSDATVIRTCKTLGFSSYQAFKVSLAVDIVTPIQAIHEDISPGDSTADIVDKVFRGNKYALDCTQSALNIEKLEEAADIIKNASRVFIFGLGNSHSVALDLQHKLMRLGIDAQAHTDSHLQTITAVNAHEGDVVFAISHSGSSSDIVDAAKLAKKNNAKIISLTNIGVSPCRRLQIFLSSPFQMKLSTA